FVDASAEFGEGKAMSFLRESDIKRITTEYKKAKQTLVDAGDQTEDKLSDLLNSVTVDKYLRVVDIAEIQKNDFNLNISRYIDTSEKEETVCITSTLERLNEINEKLVDVDKDIQSHLKLLGL
ncbi:N-6 DNA methylase, partial [Vibrio cholerae]